MNILVANDDGIHAEGLQNLVKALSSEATVYVVAPDSQRSGASHSITMNTKLYFTKMPVEGAKEAYAFTGTPADCVKMGIALFEKEGITIDCVVSGINHGGNLGTDTLYSGTVGAAREGFINNKVSLAVSVNSHDVCHGFEYACNLAVETVKGLKEKWSEVEACVLNINVPDLPKDQIKGLKVTKLGIRDYDNWFNPVVMDDGKIEICYGGKPISFDEEYSKREEMADVIAMDLGYATVTPLKSDLTYEEILDKKIWGIYND